MFLGSFLSIESQRMSAPIWFHHQGFQLEKSTFNNMSEEGVSKVIGTPFIDGREANRVSCILQTICIQKLTLYENK